MSLIWSNFFYAVFPRFLSVEWYEASRSRRLIDDENPSFFPYIALHHHRSEYAKRILRIVLPLDAISRLNLRLWYTILMLFLLFFENILLSFKKNDIEIFFLVSSHACCIHFWSVVCLNLKFGTWSRFSECNSWFGMYVKNDYSFGTDIRKENYLAIDLCGRLIVSFIVYPV